MGSEMCIRDRLSCASALAFPGGRERRSACDSAGTAASLREIKSIGGLAGLTRPRSSRKRRKPLLDGFERGGDLDCVFERAMGAAVAEIMRRKPLCGAPSIGAPRRTAPEPAFVGMVEKKIPFLPCCPARSFQPWIKKSSVLRACPYGTTRLARVKQNA